MIKPDETERFKTATLIQTIENAVSKYGNISLDDYINKIKGDRIHRCPKCLGRGYVLEAYNDYPSNLPDSFWVQHIRERKVMCSLCNGVGYTDKKYKENRKVVIDGYIEE